ncbi:hypothetical protein [Pseudaestuariivita atlantica]|uniref:Uncharacterized protein n=1 Tax=Pseudaestuariivita atlantica TaxID=1317121 RepID=A0A0L1JUU4_9RHOB|nr:hypothetical protein [Pseudaestuariivita atlantica]KNG95525.1 hypothetical protein ATO11_02740 [Pseudaestuariivita atlantica]
MAPKDIISNATLERRRRARLMELIRQQDAALQRPAPSDPPLPTGFARQFQDNAARSLGHRPADQILSLRLRGWLG